MRAVPTFVVNYIYIYINIYIYIYIGIDCFRYVIDYFEILSILQKQDYLQAVAVSILPYIGTNQIHRGKAGLVVQKKVICCLE